MMERGLPFFCIVGNDHVEVLQGDILLGGGFHNADTPVYIGRVAVAQVVGRSNGEVSAGIESLMADEHALAEGLPREVLGRGQSTVTEKTALRVDDIRVAVEYGWSIGHLLDDTADSIWCRQEVASIEETDIVAIEGSQTFVHRIIDAMIWLRDYLNAMAVLSSIGAQDIVVDKLERTVCGGPVDDEMHDVGVVLLEHAVEGSLQHGGGIIGDSDVGDAHRL